MHWPCVLSKSIHPNGTVRNTTLPSAARQKQLKAHPFSRYTLAPQPKQDQSRPDQNRCVRLRNLGKVLLNIGDIHMVVPSGCHEMGGDAGSNDVRVKGDMRPDVASAAWAKTHLQRANVGKRFRNGAEPCVQIGRASCRERV